MQYESHTLQHSTIRVTYPAALCNMSSVLNIMIQCERCTMQPIQPWLTFHLSASWAFLTSFRRDITSSESCTAIKSYWRANQHCQTGIPNPRWGAQQQNLLRHSYFLSSALRSTCNATSVQNILQKTYLGFECVSHCFAYVAIAIVSAIVLIQLHYVFLGKAWLEQRWTLPRVSHAPKR